MKDLTKLDESSVKEDILRLIRRSTYADGVVAMQLSQAACNAANALILVMQMKSQE